MNNSAFMENLRQLFAECDIDNNGCLGREEFSELCAKIGLNREAAHETFDRLDIDKDDKITFDEFAAGFNQYKQTTSSSSSSSAAAAAAGSGSSPSPSKGLAAGQPKKPPSPASTLARKSASPVGVMSLGSAGSGSGSGSASSSNNLGLGLGKSGSTSGGMAADISDFTGASSSVDGSSSGGFYAPPAVAANDSSATSGRAGDSMVVYSSEAVGMHDGYYDQPSSSGQFGSLFGAAGSTNGGSGSFSQVRNMQDLLECVQKLQSENQILTQIFFKDKREREEYISQLGEEFDQQVREVEERANRRAREELENEKKRLREMMQTERETLQHHYKTIEKMSKLINAPQNSRSTSDLLDGEGMDKVKSKLEDTYLENRQLKRSLLDTKTDVALIWKEMEKLKRQYEDKLTSAYQKNSETKSECEHIKQQLNLMKDSNRKLQDASDVITTYITDKVEPVIKGAASAAAGLDLEASGDPNYLSPNGCHSLTGSLRPGGSQPGSQSNSRRGSVLSEYLNSHPDSFDESYAPAPVNQQGNDKIPQISTDREFMASINSLKKSASKVYDDDHDFDARRSSAATSRSSSSSTSGGGGSNSSSAGALPRINLPTSQADPRSYNKSTKLKSDGLSEPSKLKKSSSFSPLADGSATAARNQDDLRSQRSGSISAEPAGEMVPQAQKQARSKLQATSSSQLDAAAKAGSTRTGFKNLGRHFFLGSKDKLSSDSGSQTKLDQEAAAAAAKQAASKSLSLDGDHNQACLVEPADGPSVATFNIILVGDSFVGKSSFAARFMEGSFVQGLISNCSIDFKTKAYKVDGVNYTVNLWDTAGQERFRSITASYFRKADGIILMYDVTDKRSYLNVRNWMSTISDTASETVAVLLVGNKIDLRVDKNKDKCVPTTEGFRLAKEYDIVFLETSVKTGTNLIPSMGRLIRLIAKNNSPEEEDDDRIRLNDKSRSFHCMPKNC